MILQPRIKGRFIPLPPRGLEPWLNYNEGKKFYAQPVRKVKRS